MSRQIIRTDKAPKAIGDMLHASTLGLFARAMERIRAS